MELVIAILIGGLFAGGLYCILRRSLMRLIIGILLLSQSVNLLVFSAAGLTGGRPAFASGGAAVPPAGYADPLPQALVLTAIVIGFGLAAFALALALAAYRRLGSVDPEAMRVAEPPEETP